MKHCTYLFKDPKSALWVYVGKGGPARPKSHLRRSTNAKLHSTIQKRQREGFVMHPFVIPAETDKNAREMEMLLIAMIGREDLGTGPLFNLSDGGEGESGRIISHKTRSRISAAAKKIALQPEKLDAWNAKMRDPQMRKKMAVGHQRACTVDGLRIFPSVTAMIQELGQGKNGTRSPFFRFVPRDMSAT